MAILASPIVDRHGTESTSADLRRRRSLVVEWLAHPQASFYLVLAPAMLLLALGMMMVLSASSVYAFTRWGDAYYFVKRQVVFLIIGGAFAFVLAKLQPRHLKIFGWALVLGALVLQLLTFTRLGFANNGNTNWVQFGSTWFRIQPSELAKLAIVV